MTGRAAADTVEAMRQIADRTEVIAATALAPLTGARQLDA